MCLKGGLLGQFVNLILIALIVIYLNIIFYVILFFNMTDRIRRLILKGINMGVDDRQGFKSVYLISGGGGYGCSVLFI